ncbi:MAG: aldo/keto reductase [Phycisphaerae bacterium]|nr:aldo/keto reductase [Phycisphaerae bacterium]
MATVQSIADYVTLGRSGLRVSPICLGAMTFGEEWGFGSDVATSYAVLSRYLERGGNFIDTANMYTKGHSEVIIGDYFTNGPGQGQRDRAVIATKFMGNLFRGDPNGGGANRKSVLSACENSLRRLRTDYIDLYWAHFWDRNTPIDELMATLDLLVKQGKVRYIGFSDHPAWVCVQAQYEAIFRHWTPLVALQIEYSLLQRTVEPELMSMARAMGMGVTPWSPLGGGVLSGKFSRSRLPSSDGASRVKPDNKRLTDQAWNIIDVLDSIARARSCTVAQVALRWTMEREGVASIIIGARTLAQLEDNIGSAGIQLTSDDVRRLDEASAVPRAFPWDFLEFVRPGIQNGTSINGVKSDVWPLSPTGDEDRW